MRFRFAVLVAVTSVLTVVSPALAGSPHSAAADYQRIRHELYEVPLERFLADAQHPDRWFDWSNDGCSAPTFGNGRLFYNFRDSCRRHDFGYRNLKLVDHRYGKAMSNHWNPAERRHVDDQFLSDMNHQCSKRSIWIRWACRTMARVYYHAVRLLGGP
jgi:hypothetical protein